MSGRHILTIAELQGVIVLIRSIGDLVPQQIYLLRAQLLTFVIDVHLSWIICCGKQRELTEPAGILTYRILFCWGECVWMKLWVVEMRNRIVLSRVLGLKYQTVGDTSNNNFSDSTFINTNTTQSKGQQSKGQQSKGQQAGNGQELSSKKGQRSAKWKQQHGGKQGKQQCSGKGGKGGQGGQEQSKQSNEQTSDTSDDAPGDYDVQCEIIVNREGNVVLRRQPKRLPRFVKRADDLTPFDLSSVPIALEQLTPEAIKHNHATSIVVLAAKFFGLQIVEYVRKKNISLLSRSDANNLAMHRMHNDKSINQEDVLGEKYIRGFLTECPDRCPFDGSLGYFILKARAFFSMKSENDPISAAFYDRFVEIERSLRRRGAVPMRESSLFYYLTQIFSGAMRVQFTVFATDADVENDAASETVLETFDSDA